MASLRVSDFIFGRDGKPPKGVFLRLTNCATGESQVTRTDGDGRFTVTLSPGTYRMEKSGPGESWREVGLDLEVAGK